LPRLLAAADLYVHSAEILSTDGRAGRPIISDGRASTARASW
jgi:hypothetical protein